MLYVADYAEKIGETDEARKVFERLTGVPEYSDRAYAGLIRIAERNGGTRTLREIMRDLSARHPDDPAPQNDLAYLNLLLNERVEASKETAEALHKAHPNVMAYRNTLALAYLRLDDPASARKLYEDLNLDWKMLQPGWQAVHAAVIGANGDAQNARVLAKEIPLNALKPEEHALIQPWL
jgi:DNA-binding SARP family transcriptional activator